MTALTLLLPWMTNFEQYWENCDRALMRNFEHLLVTPGHTNISTPPQPWIVITIREGDTYLQICHQPWRQRSSSRTPTQVFQGQYTMHSITWFYKRRCVSETASFSSFFLKSNRHNVPLTESQNQPIGWWDNWKNEWIGRYLCWEKEPQEEVTN